MAILKWPSDTFTINVSNKAPNNTGISKINAYLKNPTNSNYYFFGDISDVSNKNAQNTGASSASFSLFSDVVSYFSGSETSVDLSLTSKVSWGNGGETEPITVSGITLCNPATYIYILPNSSTIWNTEELVLGKCYFGSSYGAPYNYNSKKITLHVGSDSNRVQIQTYTDKPSSVQGANLGKITKGTFWDANGFYSGKVFAYAKGGTPVSGAVSPNELSYSSNISFKNAVNKVVLNDSETDSTIFIAKGSTTSVNYTVEPYDTNGYAYHKIYSVVKNTSENSAIATATINSYTIGSNKIATGTISIKGIAVGTTSFSIKNTNAKQSVVSKILSIYVSSGSDAVTLNCGDTYLWQIASSTGVTLNPSANARFTAAFATVGGKTYVKVTAKSNAGASTGTLELKDSTGSVISTLTVNTAHISITVS